MDTPIQFMIMATVFTMLGFLTAKFPKLGAVVLALLISLMFATRLTS